MIPHYIKMGGNIRNNSDILGRNADALEQSLKLIFDREKNETDSNWN